METAFDFHPGLLELDPKYVDVIVKRWQDLSGRRATLDGDGRTFDEITEERKKSEVLEV